jgi:hypothetical protein
MGFGQVGVKQLALVAALSVVIGAALVIAGATVHSAVQPNRALPFGLDAYLDEQTAQTLIRLKYDMLISKEVEVRGHVKI